MKAMRQGEQRGIAAITAMLVVALATVLAVELLWNTSLDLRRTQNLLERDQAQQIAIGLELLAGELLRADYEDDPAVDGLSERWAEEYGFPFEGGNVVGQLEDMQGRFNLNSLVNERGQPVPAAIEHFRRLIEIVLANDSDLDADPDSVVDAIVDWLDPNTAPDGIGGAEDGVYTNRTPPYRAANFWFTTPTELLAVANVTPELYARLENLVTALPPTVAPSINVNTARPEVLQSLATDVSSSEIQAWVENRLGVPDTNGGTDFLEQVFGEQEIPAPGRNSQQDDDRPKVPLGSNTEWFRLTVIVSVGSTRLSMYSLLQRQSNGSGMAVLRAFDTP